jgi:hypothetical protein
LVIVGGAMAAFILTDLFWSWRWSRRPVMGEVGGEESQCDGLRETRDDEVESYRNDFGQQVNAQMQEQVRNSVWNEMMKKAA